MANTGVQFGGDILVYQNTGTEETPEWEAFGHSTSHSYSGSTNMRERIHKDDGGTTHIRPGRHAPGTISINGLATYDGVDFYAIEKLRIDRERIHLKYSGRPADDPNTVEFKEDSGDKYMEAYGYITEVGREDTVDGDSTYSCTVTLDGVPTEKEVE
jgi:hypothetical protein